MIGLYFWLTSFSGSIHSQCNKLIGSSQTGHSEISRLREDASDLYRTTDSRLQRRNEEFHVLLNIQTSLRNVLIDLYHMIRRNWKNQIVLKNLAKKYWLSSYGLPDFIANMAGVDK